MDAVCLLVAGVVRATLPGPEFTLAWEHSVQKTRWEERYRVAGSALTLDFARIQGSGAGMEPPPQAVFRDGWWTWRPGLRMPELRLARSPYTGDYAICRDGRCQPMAEFVGSVETAEVVVIRACGTDDNVPR